MTFHLKETKFKKLVVFDFSSKRNKILKKFKKPILNSLLTQNFKIF